MIQRVWVDSETFGKTPIKYGTYRYVADCEPMVVSWAVDDAASQVIDLTAGGELGGLQRILDCADEVWAHFSMFDRQVFAKLGLHVPLHKWRCAMVKALAHALPGGLDALCDILRIPQDKAKLKDGKQLVRLFCMPGSKTSKIQRKTRLTHPVEWARFLEYARVDIDAMRAVHGKLPAWNYEDSVELAHWHLDQQINDRGFEADLDLARAAIAAVAQEQDRLAARTLALTNGEVASATQRDALLEHICAEYGVDLPDMQGSTLERRLADPDLPEGLRELLRVRLAASTTSTAKYRALLRGAVNGRLQGTLQFDGAGRTTRWAGRTFQPQNLPRLDLEDIAAYYGIEPYEVTEFERLHKFDVSEERIDAYRDDGIAALKGRYEDMLFPNPMRLAANLVRSCIVAKEGRKLCVADLSNIEGRCQAWLAGEEWKLQAFRDFDAKLGPDLYKLAYSNSFGVPPEIVNKEQRQIGKVQELMLGYQGGVGAYVTGAMTYGIDLQAMAKKAWPLLPDGLLGEARILLAWHRENKRNPPADFRMSDETWLVCEVFVLGWRQANSAIKSLWGELKDTCIAAIDSPGRTFTCRRFKVRRDGAWLRVGLPSGRYLCYPQPRVDDGEISYMGIDQYSRKWQRLHTYGGKIFENACQALAAHVMKDSMPLIHAAGYPVVLTVHDEVVTEPLDEDRFNPGELSTLLATNHAWCPDMPLAAAGYEAYRYRKD